MAQQCTSYNKQITNFANFAMNHIFFIFFLLFYVSTIVTPKLYFIEKFNIDSLMKTMILLHLRRNIYLFTNINVFLLKRVKFGDELQENKHI